VSLTQLDAADRGPAAGHRERRDRHGAGAGREAVGGQLLGERLGPLARVGSDGVDHGRVAALQLGEASLGEVTHRALADVLRQVLEGGDCELVVVATSGALTALGGHEDPGGPAAPSRRGRGARHDQPVVGQRLEVATDRRRGDPQPPGQGRGRHRAVLQHGREDAVARGVRDFSTRTGGTVNLHTCSMT